MSPDRTVVLVRHATAEAGGALGDRARPLAQRGRRQARDLGPRLSGHVGAFDVALVSSAQRATETYRLLAADGPDYPEPRVLDELYEARARQVLGALRALPETVRRVIVVGHEPTMSSAAALLHDARDDLALQLGVGIPTATACVVDVAGAWQDLDRDGGRVRAILRPED